MLIASITREELKLAGCFGSTWRAPLSFSVCFPAKRPTAELKCVEQSSSDSVVKACTGGHSAVRHLLIVSRFDLVSWPRGIRHSTLIEEEKVKWYWAGQLREDGHPATHDYSNAVHESSTAKVHRLFRIYKLWLRQLQILCNCSIDFFFVENI